MLDVDKETALRTPDGVHRRPLPSGRGRRDQPGFRRPGRERDRGARHAARLRALVEDFHESDLGDLLEALEPSTGRGSSSCSAAISTSPR